MSDLQSAYHFVYQKVLELWVNSGGSDWSGVMSLWLPFLTQVPCNTPLFKCLRARAGLKLLSKSRGSYVSLKCWIGSKIMLSGHHCPQIGYLWFHTGSHATQPVAHIIDPRMHRRDEALYVGFSWKFSRFYAVSGGWWVQAVSAVFYWEWRIPLSHQFSWLSTSFVEYIIASHQKE